MKENPGKQTARVCCSSNETRYPILVGIMDDDFFALKWNASLIMRDIRTTVCFEVETPTELIDKVYQDPRVDLILLDVEYQPQRPELSKLITRITNSPAKPAVVCLSQYGDQDDFITAVQNGARGFLIKNEVRMEICFAIVQALHSRFLITPGIKKLVKMLPRAWQDEVTIISSWIPHPCLTSQLQRVFTLKVLYGMSASLTAQKMHLMPGTVEKYMQYIYQRLEIKWGDEKYLGISELEKYSPEVQAFHRYNLPPILKKVKNRLNFSEEMCNNNINGVKKTQPAGFPNSVSL